MLEDTKEDVLRENNIKFGNTLSNDKCKEEKFDYMITNPPYGWKGSRHKKWLKQKVKNLGFSGRFGAGLSRIGDKGDKKGSE